MRIALSSFGTAGDLVPYVRLARALLARGHDVTVHGWAHDRGWFPEGIRHVVMGGGVTRGDLDLAMDEALRAPTYLAQVTRFARLFYGLGEGTARAQALHDSARQAFADKDLAVINALDHVGQGTAEAMGLPWVATISRPPPDPAQADPAFASIDRAVGELVAEVTGIRRHIRVFRETSPLLTLVPASPALTGPHPTACLTGAWVDPPLPLPPPAEPLLLVTFGITPDVNRRTAAVLRAVSRTGWRALVQVLPPVPLPEELPDGVTLLTERVPFATLMPQVSAVLHHGAAGTVHEVVRAGRPSLVVPAMADQPYWAALLHSRGLSPPPIPAWALDRLESGLTALRDPALADRAAAFAPALAVDPGVDGAVAGLEALRIAGR